MTPASLRLVDRHAPTQPLAEVGTVREFHQLLTPFTAYGLHWRGCTCGTHSKGLHTSVGATDWRCPHELADIEAARGRFEFEQAQLHQPRS